MQIKTNLINAGSVVFKHGILSSRLLFSIKYSFPIAPPLQVLTHNTSTCWAKNITYHHKFHFLRALPTFPMQQIPLLRGRYSLLHVFLLVLVSLWSLELFLSRDCLLWCFEAHGLHHPLEIEYSNIALGLWLLLLKYENSIVNNSFYQIAVETRNYFITIHLIFNNETYSNMFSS